MLFRSLDHRLNEAVTNLQRLITNAFNTGVRPLQQEIMDLQAQFQSNGPTQLGPTGYKANPPTPYDGSRQNGEGFIKACCLYLQLNMGCFPDDTAAIRWTLSYMTMGRAQVWRDAVIDHYTDHQKCWNTSGILVYKSERSMIFYLFYFYYFRPIRRYMGPCGHRPAPQLFEIGRAHV